VRRATGSQVARIPAASGGGADEPLD